MIELAMCKHFSSLTDLPQHLGPKPLSKYFKWQILEMMLNDLRKSLTLVASITTFFFFFIG